MNTFKFIILSGCLLLSSCNVSDGTRVKSYLNHRYELWRAGDIHGIDPRTGEVLDRNKGFTNYIDLFDLKDSFIDFQCKGTSYSDFYCEGTFRLVDKNGTVVAEEDSFRCEYYGGQMGSVLFLDKDVKEKLGTIYVYTPYWCRCQYYYPVNETDNILLTFEFWKIKANPLPSF